MSIIIKSPREIALIKEAGKIVIDLFDILKENTVPGKSTWELAHSRKIYSLTRRNTIL